MDVHKESSNRQNPLLLHHVAERDILAKLHIFHSGAEKMGLSVHPLVNISLTLWFLQRRN